MLVQTKDQGQSLIEVLVVLTISLMVLVALVTLVVIGLKNAQFAQNQAKATKYTQQALEKVKTVKDRNLEITLEPSSNVTFNDLLEDAEKCPSYANRCYFKFEPGLELVETTSDIPPTFTLPEVGLVGEITIWHSADWEKTISVKVSWSDSSGQHSSDLQTVLTAQP